MLRNLLVVLILLVVTAGTASAGEAFDFVVIQPGQPGTTEDAQPVMDALATYVGQKLGAGVTVQGRYFNQAESAAAYLSGRHPSWGIVSLGYYLAHADAEGMTPLAATRPGGADSDVWRLLAAAEGPDDWQSLRGTVAGTMLFEPEVAARLMFATSVDKLPFRLEGTSRPLRALRAVLRGQGCGVMLDASQYEAVQALPLVSGLKVVATSEPLPTAVVVAFGAPGPLHDRLRALLLAMREDPAAGEMLQLLQTEGFGPADSRLHALMEQGI